MPIGRQIKEYTNEQFAFIDALAVKLEHSFDGKWNDEGDVLKATIKDDGEVTIMFPSDTNGTFKVVVSNGAKEWFAELEERENQDITLEDVNNSIFAGNNLQGIRGGDFMFLDKNKKVFLEVEKYFKDLGFSKVYFSNVPNANNNVVCDELTLVIGPRHWNTNIDFPYSMFDEYRGLEGFREPRVQASAITEISGEKQIKILHSSSTRHPLGMYYQDRNIVTLHFNPFHRLPLRAVESFRDNEFLARVTADIEKSLKPIKYKQVNVDSFKLKIMVNDFNRASQDRIRQLRSDLVDRERRIHDYEQSLTQWYNDRVTFKEQITALDMVGEKAQESFLEELEKAKKQPLVKEIKLGNGTVDVTFVPTTIKAPVNRSVDGDRTTGKPTEMFIGSITAHLSGGGNIKVSCDHPCTNFPGQGEIQKPHPHAQQDGNPCLGSGDGPSMMHRLIGERKFSDFVYVFWMWIKRWRPEDCYIAPYIYLDDRLAHGLPVFDQVGNLVTLDNIPKTMTNLVGKDIQKAPDYEANIKAYAKFGPQK